jgi:hypothetical protein
VRLEAGDEQKVNHFNRSVRTPNTDGSTRRWNGKHFWMLDRQNPSVRQMNIEGPEGTRTVHFLQLFNRHGSNSIALAAIVTSSGT